MSTSYRGVIPTNMVVNFLEELQMKEILKIAWANPWEYEKNHVGSVSTE